MVCKINQKLFDLFSFQYYSFRLILYTLWKKKSSTSKIFFSDHVTVEMDFSKALNRLGETAIMREDIQDYGSDDIGAAFQKFSVVTKELSNLMKNLVSRGTSN